VSALLQGSAEWLEWRRKGIGSSDAPVVMGVSPWSTRYQLWEDKLGLAKPKETNWAMRRGNELEPKARAWYELTHDLEMPAKTFIHAERPYMLASLDGWNESKRKVLEIKAPGKDDHELALQGKVPEKYVWQLAHQMAVADADTTDYVSYDGETGVVVTIERSLKLEKVLCDAEEEFWELVQTKTPPELMDKDFTKLKDAESVTLFEKYRAAEIIANEAAIRLAAIDKEIKDKFRGQRIQCAGYRLFETVRKGNVDYAQIPELKSVDLEIYRKKPTAYMQIRAIARKA
jgi:putative phage-type endonuclease